eukprot:694480-Rhodomonas_salina.1
MLQRADISQQQHITASTWQVGRRAPNRSKPRSRPCGRVLCNAALLRKLGNTALLCVLGRSVPRRGKW